MLWLQITKDYTNPYKMSIGMFTKTSWAHQPLRIRFLTKVSCPWLQTIQTEKVTNQMLGYTFLTSLNLIIHYMRPPFAENGMKNIILIAQFITWLGNVVTLFAVLG